MITTLYPILLVVRYSGLQKTCVKPSTIIPRLDHHNPIMSELLLAKKMLPRLVTFEFLVD
jgi:hypothetical protein